jgi:NitT/TauT family transport system permease protein
VAVVFSLVVFPMVINAEAGIRSVDRGLVQMARSFGAKRTHVFLTVSLPAALPFVVSGLRIGVGRGLIGVVVGELFGARAGLGYLITNASQVFDMATLFVAVAILAAAGIVLTNLLQHAERRLDAWRG